jgi:hypothetical protein
MNLVPGLGQQKYYTKGSVSSIGANTIDMGILNTYFCTVKNGDSINKYTPYEVSEYGVNHSKVYKAFEISVNGKNEKYFLERQVEGKIELYSLRLKKGIRKLYLLPNDSLYLKEIQLKNKNIHEMIGSNAHDCSSATSNLKYLRPKQYSIKRYLDYLNSCSDLPYPKFHYGIKLGFAATRFYPINDNSDYAVPDYKSDYSFIFGCFIDMPIFASNLSFAPEIYFKGNHYSQDFNYLLENFNLVINYSSLNFPLLFRYKFLKEGYIPFIQLGPVYSKIVKNQSTLYTYEITDNEVFIQIDNDPIIQNDMIGFSLGCGILSGRVKKCNWFGELRYNHLYNINKFQKELNLGEFSLNTGIIF